MEIKKAHRAELIMEVLNINTWGSSNRRSWGKYIIISPCTKKEGLKINKPNVQLKLSSILDPKKGKEKDNKGSNHEIQNNEEIERNTTKACSLKKINKVDKLLLRLLKHKKAQINNVWDVKGT